MQIFPSRFSRRHFLFSSGLAGLGYMRFVEPQWLDVGRHRVKLSRDESVRPLTLLQLSDLHVSSVVPLKYVNRAITRALAVCRPDLICLTGDFITSRWEAWDDYAAILARLSAVAPTFGVMGNHDGGAWATDYGGGYDDPSMVAELLSKAGVRFLDNAHLVFEAQDWKINLVGVGDSWAEELDPDAAYRDLDPALSTVLLSHNPDTKDALADYRWDLMLSGHTHGGQLDLPVIGTPFAPVVDKRYVAGLKPWRDRWIHVTRGIGNIHGMRFNCRPEISVLEII